MKRAPLLGALLAAMFLFGQRAADAEHQPGGAATPCCQAPTAGPFAGQACNENLGGTFTVFPPGSQQAGFGGCAEIDSTGTCVGGGIATTGSLSSSSLCICVRRASAKKSECFIQTSQGLKAVSNRQCSLAAAAGCCTPGTGISGDACH